MLQSVRASHRQPRGGSSGLKEKERTGFEPDTTIEGANSIEKNGGGGVKRQTCGSERRSSVGV